VVELVSPGAHGSRPKRSHRVAERVKGELMDLLIRGVVRDPAVAGCYVTEVRVTDDLQQARVYVRLAREQAGEALVEASALEQKAAVDALNRAAPIISRELSPRLDLKYQPSLRFFWDDNLDNASRVENLLREIAQDGAGRDPS
jgi:ribosome-binding factor A